MRGGMGKGFRGVLYPERGLKLRRQTKSDVAKIKLVRHSYFMGSYITYCH
jgi:hypothetical protein